MRPDLELIEKIEDYLNGRLSAADMAAFRKQMAADPVLREKVQLQEEVMKGIERASLTQKVKSVGKSFHYGNSFKKWGWGIAVVVVTAAVLLFNYWKGNNHTKYEGSLSLYNESGSKEWSDADRKIAPQVFTINGARDTVIESKGGIVFSIPANGLLGSDGKPVNGQIQLTVKDALDAATIMTSGLSTKSGDRLLETGGMFYIDARTGDDILKIDPAKGIYAGVPADTIKPGMQLFQGKRKKDGSIDWVNPKSISHDLTTVNIEELNFYPPFYLDSLKSWGYDATNKRFTDSLYYSFAAQTYDPELDEKRDTTIEKDYGGSKTVTIDGDYKEIVWWNDYSKCGINPAKIKTIWEKSFQNTFLATREFEKRLALIHKKKNPELLDLFVNNLDKDLYVLDSMAADIIGEGEGSYGREEFLNFAALRDGNVKNNSPQFQKLSEYYKNKTIAYTDAILKTQVEFWDKQRQMDKTYDQRNTQHLIDSNKQVEQNFKEELYLNLKDAYRQLGYDTTVAIQATRPMYNVVVTNSGWNNVDRYVYDATNGREDMNYTDPETGKIATLKYDPIDFNIVNVENYDQVYLYLLPNKLSSYMKVNGSGGKFSEKLNNLMSYDLVCFAYKGEQRFFFSQKNIKPGTYSHELRAISQKQLDQELETAKPYSQTARIWKEIDFLQYQAKDRERQQNNESRRKLWLRIEPHIKCQTVKMTSNITHFEGVGMATDSSAIKTP